MVDGVFSSCYSHLSDHEFSHFGMTPLRWFPEITQWIFGEDNEAPVYVETCVDFARWVFPSVMDSIYWKQ